MSHCDCVCCRRNASIEGGKPPDSEVSVQEFIDLAERFQGLRNGGETPQEPGITLGEVLEVVRIVGLILGLKSIDGLASQVYARLKG